MTTEQLRKLARATIEAGKYATTRPWRDLPDGRGFRDVAALDKTMVIEGAALTPDDAAYIILAGDADKLARALLIEMERRELILDAAKECLNYRFAREWLEDAIAHDTELAKELETL